MTRTLHGILLTTLLATACVTGLQPPEPTKLVPVQGGEFLFGTTEMCYPVGSPGPTCAEAGTAKDASGLVPTFPTVRVTVAPFAIEEHEVTNLQYRHCYEMGACDDPKAYNAGNIDDYYGNADYDDYPVVGITADMAAQYCAFVGRRLPTEIEWERAAAGPATAEADKRRSAIADGKGRLETCGNDGRSVQMSLCNGEAAPTRVTGSSDDRVLEQGQPIHDLAGNVAEWVDGYWRLDLTCQDLLPAACDCFSCVTATCKEDCYTQCGACDDAGAACYVMCPGSKDFPPNGIPRCLQYTTTVAPDTLVVKNGSERGYRGGSFLTKGVNVCKARVSDRSQHVSAATPRTEIGFRCAKDL